MKWYWSLAILAALILSAFAVWFGGLNQDEGWYLYAANLVHEGQMVYRDFAYTQAPLMPKIYSAFTWVWAKWGLLGARVFTILMGLMGIVFAALIAKKLAPEDKGNSAALIVVMLLGCNLYHLYYLAIPKTYALAALYVMMGFGVLVARVWNGKGSVREQAIFSAIAGYFLARAAGVRISLGAILPVVGIALMFKGPNWVWFGLGALLSLFLSYGFVLFDQQTMKGFLAAQSYHTSREGFDVTWAIGSLSRLVRWYLPIFIVLGLGGFKRVRVLLSSFLAVFVVQMLAPFPYEDYQVPIMGILAIFAAVNFVHNPKLTNGNWQMLLVLGLTFATSFGSPLLEKWMTDGQDRFWSIKKDQSELSMLRDVAKRIESIDPGGNDIFTQDLYLAIETNRKVPQGLEMGPFSMLTDGAWRDLISNTTCRIAAVSGYTFAIDPPKCNERPIEDQLEYFRLLRQNYSAIESVRNFGQNATTLILLKRNDK